MPFKDGELKPAPRAFLHVNVPNPYGDFPKTTTLRMIHLIDVHIEEVPQYNEMHIRVTSTESLPWVKLDPPPPPKPPVPPLQAMIQAANSEPWATWLITADAMEEAGEDAETIAGLRILCEMKYFPVRSRRYVMLQWENDISARAFSYSTQRQVFLSQSPEICYRLERPDREFELGQYEEDPPEYKAKQFASAWEAVIMMAKAMGRMPAAGTRNPIHGTPA